MYWFIIVLNQIHVSKLFAPHQKVSKLDKEWNLIRTNVAVGQMSLSDKCRKFSVPDVGQMSLSDKCRCQTNVVLPENTTSQRFLESMFHRMLSAQNAVNTSHIVFDSYIERSIKGPERDRSGGGAIHLAAKIGITPLPKQIKKFWKPVGNKIGFQGYAKSEFTEPSRQNKVKLVMGVQIRDDGYEKFLTNATLV